MCVTFDSSGAKLLKKNSVGVIGIKLDKNDSLVFASAADEDGQIEFDDRKYSVSAINGGKRATRGKNIG
jgi:hypothetical protein